MVEKIKCAECGEIVELSSLRAHISVEHLRWVPYECGNCYPVLTYKATVDLLKAHYDSVHPGCRFLLSYHRDTQLKLRLKQIKRRSLGLQGQENRPIKDESTESDRDSITPAAQLEVNRSSALNESNQSATPANEPINDQRPVKLRVVAAELEAETSETSSEASAVEMKEEVADEVIANTECRAAKYEDSFDDDTVQLKEDSFAAEEAEKKPKRKQNLQAVCSPNDNAEAKVVKSAPLESEDKEFVQPIAVPKRRRPAAPKQKIVTATVPCDLCDELVAVQEEHILSTHMQSARFVCNRCPYKQTRKAVLLNHMAKKHPTSPEDFSDITADLAEQFQKMKQLCFGGVKQETKAEAEGGAETCDEAEAPRTEEQGSRPEEEVEPMMQLLPMSPPKVECRQCGERRRFRDPDHIWRSHMQRPRFECDVCKKQCMRISQFRCGTHKTELVDYQYLLRVEYQEQFQLCYGDS